jgi:hypothetical protein
MTEIVVMDVDWDDVSALSLPDADSMLWDSPGPPPRISGKWLIFAEEGADGDAEFVREMQFLAAVSPDDIWGTKHTHTSARLLLSESSPSLVLWEAYDSNGCPLSRGRFQNPPPAAGAGVSDTYIGPGLFRNRYGYECQ